EPASPIRDVSEGEACPTESGFIADQDRETIAKSATLPHDSAPRVTSPAADEGSMQQTISKLTALCTSLQRQHSELLAKFQAQEVEILRLKERVKVLEDRESVAAKQSGDDALIKGKSINEGRVAAERIKMLKWQGFMQMKSFRSQQRRPMTKKQKKDYYMAMIRNNLGWKVKDSKGMTFEEIEAKFATVWKQVEDFIPMGSKEEAERLKRKGEDLNQLWALVKEYLSIRPATREKEMELWVELKRLYEPDPED
nr:hypothetical protein [Tanacetum cinerariifolium]